MRDGSSRPSALLYLIELMSMNILCPTSLALGTCSLFTLFPSPHPSQCFIEPFICNPSFNPVALVISPLE